MRGLIVTIIIIFIALIMVGFLIFSGNSNKHQDQIQAEGNRNLVINESESGQTKIEQEIQTPRTYDIEIRGYSFNPSTIKIKVGDTIVWKNADSVSHTVTSDSGGELSSQYLSKGDTYTHTFTQKGTFPYHCIPHPYMKGTIIVE